MSITTKITMHKDPNGDIPPKYRPLNIVNAGDKGTRNEQIGEHAVEVARMRGTDKDRGIFLQGSSANCTDDCRSQRGRFISDLVDLPGNQEESPGSWNQSQSKLETSSK